MSKRENDSRFNIGLKENGQHSLWRGIESYQRYKETQDKWLLKEAVMFLHHGIELLMKETLVRHSEYLIFEDLGENTVKKQKQAIEKGIGIFYLPKPPRTVTYLDAIDRVEAFVNPPELDEPLLTRLKELNQHRNQLEHYAVDADAETIVHLIANLHKPLLKLFEAQLGGIEQEEPAEVSETVDDMQRLASEYRLKEQEVYALVQRFRGQKVPGHLFNVSGEFVLPDFAKAKVLPNYRPSELEGAEIDVFGESEQARWVIEVKVGLSRRALLWALAQVSANSAMLNATAWLVVFTDVPAQFRKMAQQQNVLMTGASEWKELKQRIETNSTSAAA
jgi:hypothetical protein